ncbi:MAG: HEAT repeat domain-containing protein [Bryobacteraceae bacterium]|nr:HEAT repeat domain-containing protein [Bryobacteraceae bacterium]
MIRHCLVLLGLALLVRQPAPAQAPKVGIISFYGNRKVSEKDLRRAIGISEGMPLTIGKGAMEDQIDKMKEVVDTQVTVVCCAESQLILYVGIEERGAPRFDYRPNPTGDIRLPAELVDLYGQVMAGYERAARSGSSGEDLTAGHALAADPGVRAAQQRMLAYSRDTRDVIREALNSSADPEHRAMAAWAIGYLGDKAEAARELALAVKDAYAPVRNNAIRSLNAIAVYSKLNPQAGVRISATWLVEMLNSLVWTDRNKASLALLQLSESREPLLLEQLRERALPALLEMAKWKHLPHALPAYFLVGRLAGVPEPEIERSWAEGDREKTLAAWMKKKRS